MSTELKFLHVLLSLLVFLQESAIAQDQNQHFIYNGFTGTNFHLDGLAKTLPSGVLQLTNTTELDMGHAFFPYPIKFYTNSSSNNSVSSLSFSTQFVFAMVPELSARTGHGIAFTISPSLDFKNAFSTHYLGLLNNTNNGLASNHVFAVELDTIKTPEFEDVNNNHVGIDVNNLKSNISAPVTYFSDVERKNKSLNLLSGDPMQVWIDYEAEQKQLSVTIAPVNIIKPSQPLLSASLDLSLVILDSMYVGFSSATGSWASNHYILGWSFNMSGKAESLNLSKLPPVPHQPQVPASVPPVPPVPQVPPQPHVPHRKPQMNKEAILILAVIVALVLFLILGAVYIVWRKKYEEVYEDWEQRYGPQRFSYKDLYKATKGFKDRELLGCGGFGRVYKGVLPSNNKQVAVKKISHDSQQGMKEFVAEIASMGRLRHRNLVQLLGYCRRKRELLLVYEHMPNGSVDKFLFSNETPDLNWNRRFQILKDVASALVYLHEEWEQVVIHRDVKASNVMLDADLNAKLGDFGLARFYDHGSNPRTTCVVGTIGYLAPEVLRTGKASTSGDVFGFGAFMLEMACGRKPIDPDKPPEEVVLVDLVLHWWKRGDILRTRDPRLRRSYDAQEMELVLKLGLLCSMQTPEARPSMRQVVQHLAGDAPFPEVDLDGATSGLPARTNHQLSGQHSTAPNEYDYSGVSMSSTGSTLNFGR